MAAILDNGLGALAIDLLDLRERLEADRDAAAEFPQPRLRVLQPFDPAERIQFVDVKPDTPFERRLERQRRSEEHTSELQSLMRISYAVFCLQKKNPTT